MTAREAVERFVHDGDSVFFGLTSWATALEWEVARQHKRHLMGVGAVGTVLLPLLGSVDRLITSFASGVSSPWFRERWLAGEWRIEDYTNQSISLMFMAGSLGIPFIPTRSMLGSDYVSDQYLPQPNGFLGEGKMQVMESPFGGEKVVALPAVRPDVSLIHVQWADEEGNAALWGTEADVRWGLWASKCVVISAHEIVPSSVLRSDPHRVTIPGFMVDAVVHQPFGALPAKLPGYYGEHAAFSRDYHGAMRDETAFRAMVAEWVEGCADHEAFLAKVVERYGPLDALAADRTWEPERPVRYGWKSAQ